ncbi:MAG: PAS domain-containing protein [Desulfotomaculum sp.]|nr:PAS domain-containing protein [Desulfotomaculum sp.]
MPGIKLAESNIQTQIAVQRGNFIQGLPVDENFIRPIVLQAWQRCKKNGVKNDTTFKISSLSQQEVEKSLKDNEFLLEAVKPFLDIAEKTAVNALPHYYLIVADNKGCVLDIRRNEETENVPYQKGICYTEQIAGNTALSTALHLKKPVYFVGNEHYLELFSGHSSFASPVFDSNDELIGIILLGTPLHISPEFSFALVISITEAISFELKHDNGGRQRERNTGKTSLLAANLLNNIPVGLFIFNKQGNLQLINKAAADLSGYWLTELQNRHYSEFDKLLFTFDKFSSYVDNVLLSGNQVLEAKIKLRQKSGRYIDTAADIYPLDYSGMGINGVLVVLQQYDKDKNSIQFPSYIFSKATSSIVIAVDEEGKLSIINKRAADILQVDPQKAVGSNISEIIPQWPSGGRILNSTLQNAGEYNVYEFCIDIDGENKIFLGNFDLLYSRDGQHLGILAALENINEVKCQQKKIQHQQRLAEVGQLAAEMVHEVKNPITTISGFIELLRSSMTKDQKKEQKYLEIIASELKRVRQILQNYLQFSQTKPRVMEEVYIDDIIRDVHMLLEGYAGMRNVEIVTELLPGVPRCRVDVNQIKQVFINLGQNAIQAMDRGGTLTFRTSYVVDLNRVRVDVKDNGPGMSKEDLEKLGIPFFTTKKDGTGLGLTVSYAIIAQHGGYIDVFSQPGKGTMFSIFLPAVTN